MVSYSQVQAYRKISELEWKMWYGMCTLYGRMGVWE